MTLSANQPYFMPYLPYWQLIDCADTFLVSDDYHYMKQSWIPRNRILVNGRWQYFRLEINDQSCHRLIRDTQLLPLDVTTKLRTLEMAYHKAPHFAEGYALCERVLSCKSLNLCEFLTASIKQVCDYLYITTRIAFTSDVPGNCELRKEERIYDFCRHFGADRYVNAIGGRQMYHVPEFAARGIRLEFLNSRIPPYKQFDDVFIPALSVIDAVMFLSREQLRDALDKRTFIDE
ncbi:MAG: WbqC family protein [Bacteroidales bacterium]|nr:WbqC family protein [Bacteroidales bacterium]